MEERLNAFITITYPGYRLIDYSPLGNRFIDLFITNDLINSSCKLSIHLNADNKILLLSIEDIDYLF